MKSTLSLDAEVDLIFQQTGGGAVERQAQDKLRDIIDARDFGVVADGVTDDTTAMKAAIAYITVHGGILLPPQAASSFRTSCSTIPISTGPQAPLICSAGRV